MHAPGREPFGGLSGLEEDLATLMESASAAQSRAPGRVPAREAVAARARLGAASQVQALVPGLLFPYATDGVREGFFARAERAVSAASSAWDLALESAFPEATSFPRDVSFAHPPPRGPALFPLPGGDTPRDAGAFLASFADRPWGASFARACGLAPETARALLSGVSIVEHPAFSRQASFSDEEARENILFTHARASEDWRTWSLWAHEAGHFLHAAALAREGRSVALCPAWLKETAGFAAELLYLAQESWESLARRLSAGDAAAHGVLSYWWRESLREGDPVYVPAAWNVWNALQDLGPLPCDRSVSPVLV